MDDKRLQKIIIVILCLVLMRGLIYGLFIPFDRAPDENYYFELIKAKHLQLNQTSNQEKQYVAAQMALTRYYLLHPEANPQKYSLQDFAEAEIQEPPPSREIYYLLRKPFRKHHKNHRLISPQREISCFRNTRYMIRPPI